MSKGRLMRIDEELEKVIKDFAKKNEISFRQASKELAKMNKARFNNKKILKEIRF